MNNFFFRPLQAPPYRIPGSFRGAILEDENGDFNIYINNDLCDEQKLRTIIHERMHAEHMDTRSDALAADIEKYLHNELDLMDLMPKKQKRARSGPSDETIEEFENRMFREYGAHMNLSKVATPKDIPEIEEALFRFFGEQYT